MKCASFTDDGGRTYNYEQALKVYPVPSVSYTLPKYVHTDSDISVDVDSTEIHGLKIEWGQLIIPWFSRLVNLCRW